MARGRKKAKNPNFGKNPSIRTDYVFSNSDGTFFRKGASQGPGPYQPGNGHSIKFPPST